MPDLDGGHYFFTALVPVCNVGIVAHEGMKSSPIHMVREALETLPTALQSRATEDIGIQSPFARSLRTHFARLVVLDQPFFNGRDRQDAIVGTIENTNLLAPGPVDELSCPYLMVMIDFDPEGDEPRGYFEELWGLMPAELTAVFRYCYGFAKVTDAASFADFIVPCQVETTMPFNDYWVTPPALPTLAKTTLLAWPLGGFLVPLALSFWPWAWWNRMVPWWPDLWSWHTGLLLGVVGALLGVLVDYWLVMSRGAKRFPDNPDGSLKHVLKALYLQQAFTRFVSEQQRRDPTMWGAAFRDFIERNDPANLAAPTQKPGIVSSTLAKDPA